MATAAAIDSPPWFDAWFSGIQRRRGLKSGRCRDRKNLFRNRLVIKALNDSAGNVASAARRLDHKIGRLRHSARSMGSALDIYWPRGSAHHDAQRMIITRVVKRLEGSCVCHACENLRDEAGWTAPHATSERQPVSFPMATGSGGCQAQDHQDQEGNMAKCCISVALSRLRKKAEPLRTENIPLTEYKLPSWERDQLAAAVKSRKGRVTLARREWSCALCGGAIGSGEHYAGMSAGGEWLSSYRVWLRFPNSYRVCLSCYNG